MSWESGRDKEEGTITQLLQPRVPGREQGEGSDDPLLSTRPFGLSGWETVKGLFSHGMVSNNSPLNTYGKTTWSWAFVCWEVVDC